MAKPSRFIIFQKTGFPLFIYDLRNKEVVDYNDPKAFMITSDFCLKMEEKELEPGKIYAVRREGDMHFFSLVEKGALIDVIFPQTNEGGEDIKKKTPRIMTILKKKISAIHDDIGLPNKDLSMISDSLYRDKVAPKLTSFLKELGSKRRKKAE